jgi:signal peptidase I
MRREGRIAVISSSSVAPSAAVTTCPSTDGAPSPCFVQRIVGLPGEVVAVMENGSATINGQTLSESYARALGSISEQPESWCLSANQYNVLGDNRGAACDSRVWSLLDRHSITSKVIRVYGR